LLLLRNSVFLRIGDLLSRLKSGFIHEKRLSLMFSQLNGIDTSLFGI
jgi:hypothetical protein